MTSRQNICHEQLARIEAPTRPLCYRFFLKKDVKVTNAWIQRQKICFEHGGKTPFALHVTLFGGASTDPRLLFDLIKQQNNNELNRALLECLTKQPQNFNYQILGSKRPFWLARVSTEENMTALYDKIKEILGDSLVEGEFYTREMMKHWKMHVSLAMFQTYAEAEKAKNAIFAARLAPLVVDTYTEMLHESLNVSLQSKKFCY